jgi:outer membrane protein TolC
MEMTKIAIHIIFVAVSLKVSAQVQFSESLTSQDQMREIMKVTHILHDDDILDSLVNRVYENSGLLKSFDQEILMYEEERLQKKRNWVSSFRFGVNLFSAQTTLGSDEQSITTYGLLPNVGLTMAVDPEKLVNRRSYIRQAETKRERSANLQADHKQRLKKEILGHYYDYLTLLESVVIKEKTLETRRQHVQAMQVEFKNGDAPIQQLLIVENQLHLMEEDLMKANLLTMKKKSEIEVLLGLK